MQLLKLYSIPNPCSPPKKRKRKEKRNHMWLQLIILDVNSISINYWEQHGSNKHVRVFCTNDKKKCHWVLSWAVQAAQCVFHSNHTCKDERKQKWGSYYFRSRLGCEEGGNLFSYWPETESVTCQWPLVNSNGTQSSSQAPLMPLMKRQPAAMSKHFKVVLLLHCIS